MLIDPAVHLPDPSESQAEPFTRGTRTRRTRGDGHRCLHAMPSRIGRTTPPSTLPTCCERSELAGDHDLFLARAAAHGAICAATAWRPTANEGPGAVGT
jgi:hypothetical protein